MQHDPAVSKASELFRLGLMPSVESIKAGQVRSLVVVIYPDSNVATYRAYSILTYHLLLRMSFRSEVGLKSGFESL